MNIFIKIKNHEEFNSNHTLLNEGAEICETVKSIRETARDNVDILLINDASTDSFDYEEIGRVYKVKYMVNKKRLGPAFSRDLGIGMIETDYF